jgi:hypothetical protein
MATGAASEYVRLGEYANVIGDRGSARAHHTDRARELGGANGVTASVLGWSTLERL